MDFGPSNKLLAGLALIALIPSLHAAQKSATANRQTGGIVLVTKDGFIGLDLWLKNIRVFDSTDHIKLRSSINLFKFGRANSKTILYRQNIHQLKRLI